MTTKELNGIQILGKVNGKEQQDILSVGALNFVAQLHRAFNKRRIHLLEQRKVKEQQIEIHNQLPNFLPETQFIRDDPTWKCAHPAPGLVDRRVEITGPVDRKMVINGLKSGALTYMADFEDSNAPTWENCINGQVNLRDAISRTISFTSPEGKRYFIDPKERLSTLIVRPRGWHLVEKHLVIDGEPCSASLFDFGLYFYHNAHNSLRIGAGPYFYLPKMESHLEARLWNDAFNLAQDAIGMRRGTIRATVLIETIMAAFEMEEILFELREHSSGLNCGRWDYIFSFIKKFRHNPQFILPDRASVSMTVPFMSAYVNLLIKTCHKRGVHAMGGMAAQIPIKEDTKANQVAMDKVRADKWREVKAGHDGTWVAHPALVPIALEAFNAHMPYPNQLFVEGHQSQITAQDLLNANVPGTITEAGIRSNLSVALVYVEAWLRGVGCVPIHHLMEDAATAEIARSQVWQWCRHRTTTSEGVQVTPDYVQKLLDDELAKLERSMGDKFFRSKFQRAKDHLVPNLIGEAYPDFLTTLCYDDIVSIDHHNPRL